MLYLVLFSIDITCFIIYFYRHSDATGPHHTSTHQWTWKLGDRGTEHLQCVLRYLGVLWEGTSLHIFNGFGPIQQ